MAGILKDYPSVALNPENLDGKIDFVKIFGRPDPVHIEIGSSRVTFLLNQAMAQPDVNFLGIEWAGKYYRYAINRVGRRALTNVRIICINTVHFLTNFVPDNSIECFHVYFLDPYPKKRLFNSANLEQLHHCLIPTGAIKIATDHAEYFEQIQEVLTTQSNRLEKIKFLPTASANQGDGLVQTSQENTSKSKS